MTDWLFQVTEQFIFLSDGLKWLTPYITRRPTKWPHVSYHCIGHWPLTNPLDRPMTLWLHDMTSWPTPTTEPTKKPIWQTPIPPDNNYHQKPLFWECNFKSFNLVPTKPNSHQFVPFPHGSKNQFGFKSNSRNVVFSSWPQIWGQLSLRQIQFCILIILTFILNIFVTDWEVLSLKHMQPGSMTHNTT